MKAKSTSKPQYISKEKKRTEDNRIRNNAEKAEGGKAGRKLGFPWCPCGLQTRTAGPRWWVWGCGWSGAVGTKAGCPAKRLVWLWAMSPEIITHWLWRGLLEAKWSGCHVGYVLISSWLPSVMGHPNVPKAEVVRSWVRRRLDYEFSNERQAKTQSQPGICHDQPDTQNKTKHKTKQACGLYSHVRCSGVYCQSPGSGQCLLFLNGLLQLMLVSLNPGILIASAGHTGR